MHRWGADVATLRGCHAEDWHWVARGGGGTGPKGAAGTSDSAPGEWEELEGHAHWKRTGLARSIPCTWDLLMAGGQLFSQSVVGRCCRSSGFHLTAGVDAVSYSGSSAENRNVSGSSTQREFDAGN